MISEPTAYLNGPGTRPEYQNGNAPVQEVPSNLSPSPIFVLGTPFSGSSIVSWALAQHAHITHVLDTKWLARLSQDLDATFRAATEDATTSQLVAQSVDREHFLQKFGEAANTLLLSSSSLSAPLRSRWVDCTPEHAFRVPELLRLFPRARLVHVVFDVKAVVGNLIAQSAASRQTYNADSAVALWVSTTKACLAAEMAYGSERVMRVHYQELLSAPEKVMRNILAFLGESFDDACLRPFTGLADPLSEEANVGTINAENTPHIPEDIVLLSDVLRFHSIKQPGPDSARIAKLEANSEAEHRNAAHAPEPPSQRPTSLGGRVRQAAAGIVPPNASAIVISKGDDDLVNLNGIRASHFPQDGNGRYAGYHPGTSSDAISQLEQARAAGANYLVVPSPYAWWLEYYSEFRDHLLSNYQLVFFQEDSCAIFSLLRRSPEETSLIEKLFSRAVA